MMPRGDNNDDDDDDIWCTSNEVSVVDHFTPLRIFS